MTDIVFLGISALVLGCVLVWGCTYLPGERWQMLAVVPYRKGSGQSWHGTNLTYYGFFIATSQILAIGLLLILLGALSISLAGTLMATGMVLAVCIPAARLVATVVEKKRHTFTIGGASFVGILLAPWAILLSERLLSEQTECFLPLMPVLAAMAIAYSLGEGLGRLACLSFGCCYGKPLKECSVLVQRLFSQTGTIFRGRIKKAHYESRLEGQRLVPVQAITCIIYSLTALIGAYLFLRSQYISAFLLCMTVTQIWRLLSETLRADFRGFGKISVYQKMGCAAVIYSLGIARFAGSESLPAPSVVDGLLGLWHPGILLGLQLTWLIFFICFGRSTVTTSTVSFSLIEERI